MSRIALNARLLIPGKLEGTGKFTHQCYKRLISSRQKDKFLLIFDRTPPEEFDYGENVETVCLLPPARRPWLFDIWFDYAITRKLKNWNADLFVSTDGYISRRTSVPQLNIIHDINFEHNPQWLPPRYARHFRKRFPEYARLATKLCTVSNYSKADISKCYGLVEDRITVIPNAPDSMFTQIDESSKEVARDQFCGGKPYIVFVGSLHPRKNILRLLLAFDAFKSETKSSNKLLIVGAKMWWNNDLKKCFENLTHKGDIIFTGRKSPEELNQLYSSALALCYVPYFEGFGMPIIEAMKCACPVITSNVSAMPEVAGDAALLVNPFEIKEITDAMTKLNTNSELRAELSSRGQIHSQHFNWNTTAIALWESIEKVKNRC